jgi:hypothetical protein
MRIMRDTMLVSGARLLAILTLCTSGTRLPSKFVVPRLFLFFGLFSAPGVSGS